MKKLILAIAVMALSMSVSASDDEYDYEYGMGGPQGEQGERGKRGKQGKQGEKGNPGKGQEQEQEQANAQDVSVGGDVYEARRIPVATAYAPSINPTATCMGSSTAGGQGMSIGLSMGSSWESENCMYLETARSFEQAGHKADAMAVRCQTKYAKSAPSCKALVADKKGGDPYKAAYWSDYGSKSGYHAKK